MEDEESEQPIDIDYDLHGSEYESENDDDLFD